MDKKQEAFLQELLNDFKIEATEHHQAIINGLIELEKNPSSPAGKQLIETIFREIHSLKGASRAVNQLEIGRLCQSVENVFHKAKEGNLILASAHFDILYQSVEIMNVMLTEIEAKEKSISANSLSQTMKRLDMVVLDQIIQKPAPSAPPAIPDLSPGQMTQEVFEKPLTAGPSENFSASVPEKVAEPLPLPDLPKASSEETLPERVANSSPLPDLPKTSSKDTVRISTSKLGTLLREAEEFISVKATLAYYIREIKKHQNRELSAITREMVQFHHSLSRMIDDLLLDIKTTLLYPFSTLLDIVPKIVRDLGKEYEKEINLTIRGGEIEIDRRILEEIKDPLIHLIRNCIDHGLETPEIRKKSGKKPSGELEVTITQDSGRSVVLSIRDDGAGIDREKVIQSAVKSGTITRESADRMTDTEVFSLILKSGVSTSQFITDISGRGLGMAIVAEKVSKLGGSMTISSIPSQGTTFTILLPVTISNFRGVLVQVNDQFFILPTVAVERAVRIHKHEINHVESKQVIVINNESIALVRLGDVLGIQQGNATKAEGIPVPVLIVNWGEKRVAFSVDKVFGEQEGMVKSMGPQLIHVRNIAGVTILGDGQVIPILNISELMDSAVRVETSLWAGETAADDETAVQHQHYILVAEDSITLRSLLKNILESAGYRVKTAVDGMEAFLFLKNEVFDLVVSDVEMPRLNGFDLTVRIRGDKSLAEIPVILVTALDSPDDRQRGMESGANAYIVKGSFEQSNLIEIIHRLI